MEDSDYKIVFRKLDELTASERTAEGHQETSEIYIETAEVAELRKLSLEISGPQDRYYTLS